MACRICDEIKYSSEAICHYEEGFAAGRESVLAMLREPSEEMRKALFSRMKIDEVQHWQGCAPVIYWIGSQDDLLNVFPALATAIEAAQKKDG